MSTPDLLTTWLEEERAVKAALARGPGPGVATPEQLAGKTGLEMMQAMMRGEVPFAHMGQTLDFFPVEIEEGRAVFQGVPSIAHLNPMGGVHGGWFATLLDTAVGCAIHTRMPAGRGYTTAELSVNIVKGLTPKVSRVRAQGRVIHCGRQLATAEGQLVGPDGTLYAHATTTCLVFDLPGAARA